MPIRCSACQKADRVVLEDDVINIYKCGHCGHLFKDTPKEKEERYGTEYYSEEHKNWFDNPNYPLFESIYREIVRLKGNGRLKILDIGCGKGDFLKYLKKRDPNLELSGIDLTDNAYPGIRFMKGDILSEDIKCGFDVICNIAVLEHISFPLLLMEKIYDSLSQGGVSFTVTVNGEGMIYKIAGIARRMGIAAPYRRLYSKHHLQFFSNRSLRILTEKAGFDQVSQKNHNHPIKSVDYPKAGAFTKALFVIAVYVVFGSSGLLNNGVLQTSINRKR